MTQERWLASAPVDLSHSPALPTFPYSRSFARSSPLIASSQLPHSTFDIFVVWVPIAFPFCGLGAHSSKIAPNALGQGVPGGAGAPPVTSGVSEGGLRGGREPPGVHSGTLKNNLRYNFLTKQHAYKQRFSGSRPLYVAGLLCFYSKCNGFLVFARL